MQYNKSITATVYVINDGKVLLHEHKKYHTWFPLGGHIEADNFRTKQQFAKLKRNPVLMLHCLKQSWLRK